MTMLSKTGNIYEPPCQANVGGLW